jgi:hypothetical protein
MNMSENENADRQHREDRAYRALIVAALRQDDCAPRAQHLKEDLDAALSDEDRRALESLGDDLVDRVMAGDVPKAGGPPASNTPSRAHLVGVNRGTRELTEQARAEMERRIREAKGLSNGESGS